MVGRARARNAAPVVANHPARRAPGTGKACPRCEGTGFSPRWERWDPRPPPRSRDARHDREDVAVDGGAVSFTLVLTTSACRSKARSGRLPPRRQRDSRRHRIDQDHEPRAQAKDPSADRKALAGVAHVIAVGAGKGGGASPRSPANLAIALAQTGATVGLDGDIYRPTAHDGREPPAAAPGRPASSAHRRRTASRFMSMGLLVEAGEAVVWRGDAARRGEELPATTSTGRAVTHLIIDLPPGTGATCSRSSSRRS